MNLIDLFVASIIVAWVLGGGTLYYGIRLLPKPKLFFFPRSFGDPYEWEVSWGPFGVWRRVGIGLNPYRHVVSNVSVGNVSVCVGFPPTEASRDPEMFRRLGPFYLCRIGAEFTLNFGTWSIQRWQHTS